MAIFSIYTGVLYNEAFSIPTNIFGAGHWACPGNHTLTDRAAMILDRSQCPAAFEAGLEMTSSAPYAFGVDPTWHGTRSELTYLNSLKMKMSIIMGIFLCSIPLSLSQKTLDDLLTVVDLAGNISMICCDYCQDVEGLQIQQCFLLATPPPPLLPPPLPLPSLHERLLELQSLKSCPPSHS